jgi:hypothetical protein
MKFLLVLLLFGMPAPTDPYIPALQGLQHFGCNITEFKTGYWKLDLWAEHDGKRDWIKFYSMRHSRDKVFDDCQHWIKKVNKEFAKSVEDASNKRN